MAPRFRTVLFVLLQLGLVTTLHAQTLRLSLVPFASGFTEPVLLTSAKDQSDRKFIVEQVGRIRVMQPGATTSTLFLDVTSKVLFGDERGLLGLTFHPQFATNGRYYVNYTQKPDGATVVAEYRNGIEQRVLFTVPQPYENHNGGMVEFGPDGLLYIGMGDGGSANDPQNRAQNPNELLGKILRINVDIPGSRPEIFASGMRNPWRFSFDRLTGQMIAGDVGQSAREEIDVIVQGGNYGWRIWEGTRCTGLGPGPCTQAGFIPPIAEYENTGGNGRCSIIGGYVYRGVQASLPYGAYVYGDWCSGEIFMLKDGVQTVLLDTGINITSFGEDEAGEIYVVGSGSILRLTNPDAFRSSQVRYMTGDLTPAVFSTAGSAGALTIGYARLRPDPGQTTPAGLEIFGFQRGGVLVSEASVPALRPARTGRLPADVGVGVNTGIAMVNPNDAPAVVSFYFTDSGGSNFNNGTTTIPPRQQIASFLDEAPFAPFTGSSSISGTFTFTSSVPIAAIALRGLTNERGDFLITTLPVIEPGAATTSTTIAHFASGGGWTTEVILVNPSDNVIAGTAQFLNQTGQTLQVMPYSLAPRSSGRIPISRPGTDIQTGSVRLSAGVSAVSIFTFVSNGVTVSQAGAPTLPPGTAFRAYVEMGNTIRSGIAIANPSANAVDVTLELAARSTTISIPANGQIATFVNEVPAFAGLPSSFQNVLRITAPSPIAVTGLRSHTNERGEFLVTTTTPLDEAVPATSSELFFPHFAEGSGYNMQFILFGREAAGSLYLIDPSGDPVSLLFR
jgi:hypothetical protein